MPLEVELPNAPPGVEASEFDLATFVCFSRPNSSIGAAAVECYFQYNRLSIPNPSRMVKKRLSTMQPSPQAESATEREARQRLLEEQVPAIFWTTDRDLRVTSSVGAGMAALGLAPSDVVGKTLAEYLRVEDPEF